jgi:hypothetical protein
VFIIPMLQYEGATKSIVILIQVEGCTISWYWIILYFYFIFKVWFQQINDILVSHEDHICLWLFDIKSTRSISHNVL